MSENAPNKDEMDLNKGLTQLTGLNITGIIHGVIEYFAGNSSQGLGESRHAPKKKQTLAHTTTVPQTPQRASSDQENLSRPSKRLSHPIPPQSSPVSRTNTPTHTVKAPDTKMPEVADIDDTAGFMAAARALKLGNNYGTPATPTAEDVFADSFAGVQEAPHTETNDDLLSSSVTNNDISDFQPTNGEEFDHNIPETDFGVEGNSSLAAQGSDKEAAEQNREHLGTFETWGTPAVRDKPAAQIRRVVIRGLPSAWSTPDKVLSLIHGGIVESVNVVPSNNMAHVLFCDHAACNAFHEKHPNGIDLDKERKYTAFVDMGKEVDVVSSQLEFNLSVGSTRVVRAVGVDMEVTMNQLYQIASSHNRKVEKIIDSYVPGLARQVTFRFCSIEDAVRFRAMLIREQGWEHCNVQYATDPCEMATGYHAD